MKSKKILILVAFSLLAVSCEKSFLDAKPNKALLVPETITDFQNLVDDFNSMNSAPGLHIISSDDRYIPDDLFSSLPENEKNAYNWQKNIDVSADWAILYRQVFNCNVALEGLEKINPVVSDQEAYNNALGSALFFRAYAFYQLAELFTLPFDAATADATPGILLRLKADVNDRPARATLAQTYDQITRDLIKAAPLLPVKATLKTRPSRPAAQGLLARVYLTMGKYDASFEQADKSLTLNNTLLDYNSLAVSTASNTFPVALPNGNDEVLFATGQMVYVMFSSALAYVDKGLYASYAANDLRKVMYYRDRGNGNATFKASYNGNLPLLGTYKNFSGIAIDEIYLIRAECNARLNRSSAAMSDLNNLLIKRWKTGTFTNLTATDPGDALNKVLTERRKELFSRGTRWSDLKRLNKESNFAVTLTRTINGQVFTLKPNDNKYAFPFPENELSDKVLQNLR